MGPYSSLCSGRDSTHGPGLSGFQQKKLRPWAANAEFAAQFVFINAVRRFGRSARILLNLEEKPRLRGLQERQISGLILAQFGDSETPHSHNSTNCTNLGETRRTASPEPPSVHPSMLPEVKFRTGEVPPHFIATKTIFYPSLDSTPTRQIGKVNNTLDSKSILRYT